MGFYHRVEVLTDEQRAQEWEKRHPGSTVRCKTGLVATLYLDYCRVVSHHEHVYLYLFTLHTYIALAPRLSTSFVETIRR